MYTKPMIFPLNTDGTLYYIQDEKGNCVGTGTRDVCHTILQIMMRSALPAATTVAAPRDPFKQSAQTASAARVQKVQSVPFTVENSSPGLLNSIRDGSRTIFK